MIKIYLLLLCCLCLASAGLPGAKIVLNQAAFTQVNEIAVPLVLDILGKTPIPNMSFDEDVTMLGKIHIDVYSVKITKMQIGKSAITVTPKGLLFTGTGIAGAAKGLYKYKYVVMMTQLSRNMHD